MHKGPFIGKNADSRKKRILILCESHHTGKDNSVPGIEAKYKTEEVIREDYYNLKSHSGSKYLIFDKIVRSFGIDPDKGNNRYDFWENVYFGNYIDVLCGIGDNTAKNTIKSKTNGKSNRIIYNNELFEFINEKGIDIVFCFSRLVFNNLPSLSKQYYNEEIMKTIGCTKTIRGRDYIACCKYLPNIEHGSVDVKLNKEITVFGMRHPSSRWGYDPVNYSDILKQEYNI